MTPLEVLIDLTESAEIPRVYELGKVPASPVYPYAAVSLSSPNALGRTLDGSAWTDLRFVVQMFGRSQGSVIALAEKFDAIFDGQILADFPDEPMSWREIGTGPYRDPDSGGVLSIVHTYRI